MAASPDSLTGRALAGVLGAGTLPRSDAPRGNVQPGRFHAEHGSEDRGTIEVRGAHKHNLRHIDLDIPRGEMTVITGVSGSGKTSLALDTLFAEGQRRYVESLSTYARRFLGRLDKGDVDRIDGLCPAIAIDQKTAPASPRSTVATVTEISDYLRILFARAGRIFCPDCGERMEALDPARAAARLLEAMGGRQLTVLAPLAAGEAGRQELEQLRSEGHLRVLVDGRLYRLDTGAKLPGSFEQLELVVDRLEAVPERRSRLAEAVQSAYARSGGRATIRTEDAALALSEKASCPACGFELTEELSPRHFSFNTYQGACPTCQGLGVLADLDTRQVVLRWERPVASGGIKPNLLALIWDVPELRDQARAVLADRGHDIDRVPIGHMDRSSRRALLQGQGVRLDGKPWPGLIGLIERRLRQHIGDHGEAGAPRSGSCPDCGGLRLRREVLAVRVGGLNLPELSALTVQQARQFMSALGTGRDLTAAERAVHRETMREIGSRLDFLDRVGLGYLSLDRPASTLSGGEAQRIRLAQCLGARLSGCLYVLDEPTVGLHPRDVDQLLDTLRELKEQDNTVVLVEHDLQTIRKADLVVDLGPGAGERGGRILARGSPDQVARNRDSVTGAFLSGRRSIPVPPRRRSPPSGIVLAGARCHNLKGIDVLFPAGAITCVTGVSGSGKSSLVVDTLEKAMERHTGLDREPGPHDRIEVPPGLRRVVVVDQSPIGRSPSSTPGTYLKALDPIRELFASLPESRMRGHKKGRFSFNTASGRCPACKGKGQELVQMHFLSDVWVRCEQCGGRRFGEQTLRVRYRGHSIADVLDLEVEGAIELFSSHPRIVRRLSPMSDVGLGYIKLGQPAPTLSGGEAQRLKLALHLEGRGRSDTLYVLDEPTTGLHAADVQVLLEILHRLADRGATVVVVEHNLEVIKSADRVIDLGPEGGRGAPSPLWTSRPGLRRSV